MTPIFKTDPVGDNTANLQPVLNAGSNPRTTASFIGGVSNKFSKFIGS